jgi:polysaccharide biosynthesis/export protein
MNTTDLLPPPAARPTAPNGFSWRCCRRLGRLALGTGLLVCLAGCVTPSATAPTEKSAPQAEAFTLQEGDVLKISFPGAPNLDSAQTIRRDGKITLAMVGEISAIGRTPTELEQELLKLYASQLVSKEVTVMVTSSSYAVFVSGAVLRPGKISVDRPITALEAIMEAGGFDTAKADLRAVKVVRQEGGGTKNYTIDLKLVLDGKSSEPFYLKRSDIIFVPEKFSWF